MRKWKSYSAGLLLAFVCCYQTSGAAEQAYSMKDLRALADQGAWSELVAHLEAASRLDHRKACLNWVA